MGEPIRGAMNGWLGDFILGQWMVCEQVSS